jgi:hypothetical protein
MAVKLPLLIDVVDIASLADEETRILQPKAAAADFWSMWHMWCSSLSETKVQMSPASGRFDKTLGR